MLITNKFVKTYVSTKKTTTNEVLSCVIKDLAN